MISAVHPIEQSTHHRLLPKSEYLFDFVAIIYKLLPVAFSETIIYPSNHDVELLVFDDRRGAGRTLLPEGTGECRMSEARDNRSTYK